MRRAETTQRGTATILATPQNRQPRQAVIGLLGTNRPAARQCGGRGAKEPSRPGRRWQDRRDTAPAGYVPPWRAARGRLAVARGVEGYASSKRRLGQSSR